MQVSRDTLGTKSRVRRRRGSTRGWGDPQPPSLAPFPAPVTEPPANQRLQARGRIQFRTLTRRDETVYALACARVCFGPGGARPVRWRPGVAGGDRGAEASAGPRRPLDHGRARARGDRPRDEHGLQDRPVLPRRDRVWRRRRGVPREDGFQRRPRRGDLEGGRARAGRLRRCLPQPHRHDRQDARPPRDRFVAGLPSGHVQRAVPGRRGTGLGGRG